MLAMHESEIGARNLAFLAFLAKVGTFLQWVHDSLYCMWVHVNVSHWKRLALYKQGYDTPIIP